MQLDQKESVAYQEYLTRWTLLIEAVMAPGSSNNNQSLAGRRAKLHHFSFDVLVHTSTSSAIITLDRSGKKLLVGEQTMYWILSKPVPLWSPVIPIITLVSTYTG
jgi:hypothetical protein